MATNKNTRNSRNNKNAFKPVEIMKDWLLYYRENEWGLFALEHGGAIIYGCKLLEGSNGVFIAFPSRKGSDGKYYNHARFTDMPVDLPDAIAEAIGF